MPEMPNDTVLYWYTASSYARRVVWYLNLRGLPWASCIQPPIMPRPDLQALNVNYRRIPLLSMGKDVYLDTRLILRKLEERFPDGALGATNPEHRIIERLLERWMTDGGVFWRAVQLLPVDAGMWMDPAFQKDRADLTGGRLTREGLRKLRPEAVVAMRDCFELLETTILSDGREWVFNGSKPSLGDIEAIWLFAWLADLPGALPESVISKTQFPKVFAWIARFKHAIEAAREAGPKAVKVKGSEVLEYITGKAKFAESIGEVDANDPLGLKAGDEVEIWPHDSGFSHKDRGRLVTLTPNEVVISKKIGREGEIRLHAPRWGFSISKIEDGWSRL